MNNLTVASIDAYELNNLLNTESNLCLIDVREPNEWQISHIAKATHIPKGLLTEKISSLVKDKEQPIYLYCRSGTRSFYAGESLIALGYKKVYSVTGGILGWQEQGYPIEQ